MTGALPAGSVGEQAAPVCGTCGTSPSTPEGATHAALTWTRGVERGRVTWTCEACSRRFLRGIEGKLDTDWW